MNDHSNDLYRRLITDENNQVRDRQSYLISCPPFVFVRQELHTRFSKRFKIINYTRAHTCTSLCTGPGLLNTESALCRNVISSYLSVNYVDTFPIESQVH